MADQLPYEPFIPADQNVREFSFRAVALGVVMAVVLGAANAYIGMVAGLTIAATFPAAVVALAALRPVGGTILEENIARTTASVGEALVAGAIFTIPAFVIAGVWESINLWIATFIMMVGGILGVLFVIILRRTLVEESGLPFPESIAASEIHKAGQRGTGGGKLLLAAGSMAAVIELLKNASGLRMMRSELTGWWSWGSATGARIGGPEGSVYTGGMFASTPSASPALLGVGYIIGPALAAVVFAGGVLGWWGLVPVMMFVNRDLLAAAGTDGYADVAMQVVWQQQVRPLAVGTMVVGAAWTLWRMRASLAGGFARVFRDVKRGGVGAAEAPDRHETDIRYKWIVFGILGLLVPITALYYYFTQSFGGSVVAAVVMVVAGILFAAVAGYLVGLIGSSNNPISGLTLSTLILAALLMVAIGMTGDRGVLAVLGVAAVVCTAMGIAGDMMQDLKVGHILGGTPAHMEKGELIAVILAAPGLAIVLALLGSAYGFAGAPGADPATALPAPQAGLMALVSTGIINGEMPWPLFIGGMLFALVLILVRAPSVMLVAVGMYLPIWSTFAIFVGGVFRWIVDRAIARRHEGAAVERADNAGILVASGFVAGEALMGVLIAALIVANLTLPTLIGNELVQGLLGLLVFPLVLWFFHSRARRAAEKPAEEASTA